VQPEQAGKVPRTVTNISDTNISQGLYVIAGGIPLGNMDIDAQGIQECLGADRGYTVLLRGRGDFRAYWQFSSRGYQQKDRGQTERDARNRHCELLQ
jgi:hypothetical protein